MRFVYVVFLIVGSLLFGSMVWAKDSLPENQPPSSKQSTDDSSSVDSSSDVGDSAKKKDESTISKDDTDKKEQKSSQPSPIEPPPPAGMPNVDNLTPPAKDVTPVSSENKNKAKIDEQTQKENQQEQKTNSNFEPPPPAGMPNVDNLTPPALPLKNTSEQPSKEKEVNSNSNSKASGNIKQEAVHPNQPALPVAPNTHKPKAFKNAKFESHNKRDKSLQYASNGSLVFHPGMYYKYSSYFLTGFPIDSHGTRLGHETFGMQLFRVSPSIEWKEFKFKLSVDILRGQVWGDTNKWAAANERLDVFTDDPGADISSFRLRELFVSWKSRVGLLKVGLQASKWGLGLLSNNGERNHERFGESWFGDYYGRILFATKPAIPIFGKNFFSEHFLLILGGDMVVSDENAYIGDGDMAFQFIGALLFDSEPVKLGFYGAYRYQEDTDGDMLKVGVSDIYLRLSHRFFRSEWFDMIPSLEGEFALLRGTTTRLEATYAEDGLKVRSMGGVVKAAIEMPYLKYKLDLELGYASGDSDPYDDVAGTFFFDPDFNVGLILFDEILPAITANAVFNASSPSHVAIAAKGLDLLPTGGRVSNTWYVFPTLTLKPVDFGRFMIGVLWAWSDARLFDPYQSVRNGITTSPYGKVMPDRFMGSEIDISYTHWWRFGYGLRLELGVQAGMFFPGAAFESANGNTPQRASKLLGSVMFGWL